MNADRLRSFRELDADLLLWRADPEFARSIGITDGYIHGRVINPTGPNFPGVVGAAHEREVLG